MAEPVVVWNNYADSIVGFAASPVVTVSVPDELWDSWPDSTDFPGYKQWFASFSCASFSSGPFLPTGHLEVKNEPDGAFTFFQFLFPDGHGSNTWSGAGGNGLIRSQTLSFRITSQGGEGQVYQWTGLNLLLVPPVSGSGGVDEPPPPPVVVPVPVVHALTITVRALFSDSVTVRRGRSFGQLVG